MPTDSFARAALSAAVVGLVLALLRCAGPRAGGLAAAVPVSSVPALFWLSIERGGGFAAAAAAGSLAGTAVTALLVLVAIALAQRALERSTASSTRRGGWRADAPVSMGAAGGMSLVVGELSRHGGPLLCGLVAAAPVVALATVAAAHRQGGAALSTLFLRGYLDGMLAKAVFLGALGLTWSTGAGMAGWPVAVASAGAALRIQRTVRQRRMSK
jgi:hypothetical protein